MKNDIFKSTPDASNAVAVIVAGGSGQRMGAAIPKQFLPLNSKPVLYYSIKAFKDALPNIKIVLVLPEQHISYSNMVLQAFEGLVELTIVAGGNNRFESVYNGLREAIGSEIVFVHDGVRPLIDSELILRCYHTARAQGSAIPVIPVIDSIRQFDQGRFKAVDRSLLRAVQTPQTFQTNLLLEAFEQPYQPAFTDEATVVETFGTNVVLVEGAPKNIKITTPEDLAIAETLMLHVNN
jgi:2-C-methyl-D-erythritol 4-phosphate cytidylyltransferase